MIREKELLATRLGVKKSKIDSDLTNWRRRSGWTEMKDKYCGGDKAMMKSMIEGVESGSEQRAIAVEQVEKMKAYLEKREEKECGSWVTEVLRRINPRD
jgi:hypothetical protein